MDQQQQKEVYILDRDSEESARLNKQHLLLTEVVNNQLIHESIPRDRIQAVADVATGTGIWLQDVSRRLEAEFPASTPRYFHGFDISPAQFPAEAGDDSICFSVQDLLQPFPAEHLNRYDVVHVRLVLGAIPEASYSLAVANLLAILKPAGYIEWEELDFMHAMADKSSTSAHPVASEILEVCMTGMLSLGLCVHPSDKVYEELKQAGFVRVAKHSFDMQPLGPKVHSWVADAWRSLLPRLVLAADATYDKQAARDKSDELIGRWDEAVRRGQELPVVDWLMLVAQKPQ